MTFRATPEDEERPRARRARRDAEHEPEFAASVDGADPRGTASELALEAPADRRAKRPKRNGARGLRPLGGFGSPAERGERLLSLAFSGVSDATLRGLRRELAARLTEAAPGSPESRTLAALLRAVRRELARRAARGAA